MAIFLFLFSQPLHLKISYFELPAFLLPMCPNFPNSVHLILFLLLLLLSYISRILFGKCSSTDFVCYLICDLIMKSLAVILVHGFSTQIL